MSTEDRISKLIKAFDSDGYTVSPTEDVVIDNNYIGMRATHKTAVIGTSRERKKAFYLEGDPFTMGYLMGKLAEPEIERMCTEFNENIVFAFLDVQIKEKYLKEFLGKLVEDLIYLISKNIKQDVPDPLHQEIQGMLKACTEVNKKTKVDEESLWVLNVGIDAILSYVYTGILPIEKKIEQELKPEYFKVPIMCNGYSTYGNTPDTNVPYHFMGRDFMFPTADVFQDTATMIIRKPATGIPTISVAAPGMIGSIAGINNFAVGVGVDMSPAASCDPERAGLNSLLLARWSIENGNSCQAAVDVMVNAQRGVTWDYILSDGINDTACIVEAGKSEKNMDFLQYTEDWAIQVMESVDPDFKNLLKNPSAPLKNGLMERWNGYQYPDEYSKFNEPLIDAYRENHENYKYIYNPEDFSARGFLNKTWTDNNCPGPYYFAPQREQAKSTTIVTNHYIIPEMRLLAMNWWTAVIADSNLNDIQWRYDELNTELLDILAKGFITYEEAKKTIDFLAPYNKFPDYYNKDQKPLNQVQVHGSVSVLDLKEKTIESHYGYYSDEWIKLSLRKYVE